MGGPDPRPLDKSLLITGKVRCFNTFLALRYFVNNSTNTYKI